MVPTCALIRILGNDLPPRHRDGQTRDNLIFTLENEPRRPNFKRVWALNAILDKAREEVILDILNRHGEEVFRVPFNMAAYRASTDVKAKVLELIPINRMRNLVIEHHRRSADWILPLDGNCIFDENALDEIERAVTSEAPAMVLAIPMIRLANNDLYFSSDRAQLRRCEPQVCLSGRCALRFDELRAYGDDNKVEFVKRVFPADAIKIGEFGTTVSNPSFQAGVVYRLSSGSDADLTVKERHRLRGVAIANLLANADRLTK